MKRVAVFLLLFGGCGAEIVDPGPSAPLTNLDVILASCEGERRESVLSFIEAAENALLAGVTFRREVDLLDAGSCGAIPACRVCALVVLEWVFFGTLP